MPLAKRCQGLNLRELTTCESFDSRMGELAQVPEAREDGGLEGPEGRVARRRSFRFWVHHLLSVFIVTHMAVVVKTVLGSQFGG